MSFQNESGQIRWKLHFRSSPDAVFQKLISNEGRAAFWAESAVEKEGNIHFVFPSGVGWKGRILESDPPHRFKVEYYGGSITTFDLESDGAGGTDLSLIDQSVSDKYKTEVIAGAGWISVLMALKASVDFGVDLRNHDPKRTWDQG
ncbi:MAG TPA: SRPBCC domain-containing protein, partial [Anaerolineales bacterium]|nr:SRPBCC domain-containing protein [Anaerolineales bacterium]